MITNTTNDSTDDLPPCEHFDRGLLNHSYYHGWIPRDDLPYLLKNDGDFLVRISEAESMGTRLEMVLSICHDPEERHSSKRKSPVNSENIVNLIIQSTQNKYHVNSIKLFDSIDDLINYFSKHTLSVRNLELKIRNGIPLAPWEFPAENLQLGATIAKTGCIEMRKGLFKRNASTKKASVTTVRGRSSHAKHVIQEMMRQCRLLRDLHHPCVVEFYGICMLTHPCCFLMEYVSAGPLDEYLKKGKNKFKRDELLRMVMSSGWGLDYIHSNGIIHRDLSAKNCFYDKQLVKISGFGLARKATTYTMKTLRKLSVQWMAPETLEQSRVTQKSDIYSFGVLIYEIFSQSEPYEGCSSQGAKFLILQGKLNDFPSNTPKKLAEYVRDKLWIANPDERPSMEQVIQWLFKYTGMKLQLGSLGKVTIHQNTGAPVLEDQDYKAAQEGTNLSQKPLIPEENINDELRNLMVSKHPLQPERLHSPQFVSPQAAPGNIPVGNIASNIMQDTKPINVPAVQSQFLMNFPIPSQQSTKPLTSQPLPKTLPVSVQQKPAKPICTQQHQAQNQSPGTAPVSQAQEIPTTPSNLQILQEQIPGAQPIPTSISNMLQQLASPQTRGQGFLVILPGPGNLQTQQQQISGGSPTIEAQRISTTPSNLQMLQRQMQGAPVIPAQDIQAISTSLSKMFPKQMPGAKLVPLQESPSSPSNLQMFQLQVQGASPVPVQAIPESPRKIAQQMPGAQSIPAQELPKVSQIHARGTSTRPIQVSQGQERKTGIPAQVARAKPTIPVSHPQITGTLPVSGGRTPIAEELASPNLKVASTPLSPGAPSPQGPSWPAKPK